MSITVKDIARESGLSLTTVIHILGGRGDNYRTETRERVLAVARRLGYRRNSSARAMRRGCFDCVTLLMCTEPDTTLLRQPALEGICDALAARGMHLNVARSTEASLVNESFAPKMLREWMTDGILVAFAVRIPPRMVRLIEASALPCIWMRSLRAGDCIYPDERGAAMHAVQHLVRLGHTRIALADYTFGRTMLTKAHFGVRDSEAGYREAMRQAGLPARVIREDKRVERVDRVKFLRAVLEAPGRPTALYAPPSTALPAVYAAAQLGLRIPEDLSLVTVAEQVQDGLGLSLTTLLTPEYELGRQAAEMLIERIHNPKHTLPPKALSCDLMRGDSCAPPTLADNGRAKPRKA